MGKIIETLSFIREKTVEPAFDYPLPPQARQLPSIEKVRKHALKEIAKSRRQLKNLKTKILEGLVESYIQP